MQNHARIERQQLSGVASSGLMSISLIQGCSITNWLKRTSSCSRADRLTGLRPRTPCSAVKIRVCSIKRLRKRGIQWRQSQGVVAIDLDHHPAGPKQDHRAKLCIDRAAQNEFVSVAPDHPLNRNSAKVCGSRFFGDGTLN